jgi:hypothetical protein
VQSYVDAWAFALVALVLAVRVGALTGKQALRVAVGGVAGLLLTAAVLFAAIAATWLTLDQLWFQLVGFRLDANVAVLEATDAPQRRLMSLLGTALVTGMFALVAAHAAGLRAVGREPRLWPAWGGAWALLAVSVVGMYVGGDWWQDYLLQPIPALVVAAAVAAPAPAWSGRLVRVATALAVVMAVVAQVMGVYKPLLGTPTNEAATGRWLAAAADPADQAVVIWGKANVLHAAGMTSPYPFLWSLIARTLDPELDLMVATLSGPEAPTWVVIWHDLDSWGLDEDGRLRTTVREHYELVGSPCGAEVLLRRGEDRQVLDDDLCGRVD